jgi:hypothetical protein
VLAGSPHRSAAVRLSRGAFRSYHLAMVLLVGIIFGPSARRSWPGVGGGGGLFAPDLLRVHRAVPADVVGSS